MANHAGLKNVIKTVRTKKGQKRQTFWVKAQPDAPKAAKKAPSGGVHPASRAKTALKLGALGAAAYGGYRLLRHLHGKKGPPSSKEMGGAAAAAAGFAKHIGRAMPNAKATTATFGNTEMFGNVHHEANRVARPVSFGHSP
jgi:hypothetical protein